MRLVFIRESDDETFELGAFPVGGKWSNTSTQINRVDLLNGGAGDFAVGSYVEIWG